MGTSTILEILNNDYLYNNYVARDGKIAADTYSARPGHSEHQTGLALDINTEYKNNIVNIFRINSLQKRAILYHKRNTYANANAPKSYTNIPLLSIDVRIPCPTARKML